MLNSLARSRISRTVPWENQIPRLHGYAPLSIFQLDDAPARMLLPLATQGGSAPELDQKPLSVTMFEGVFFGNKYDMNKPPESWRSRVQV